MWLGGKGSAEVMMYITLGVAERNLRWILIAKIKSSTLSFLLFSINWQFCLIFNERECWWFVVDIFQTALLSSHFSFLFPLLVLISLLFVFSFYFNRYATTSIERLPTGNKSSFFLSPNAAVHIMKINTENSFNNKRSDCLIFHICLPDVIVD